MKSMSKVYMAFSADYVHSGHMRIIKEGQKLGELTVGLLTDEAIARYKKTPTLNYNQRKEVIENLKGVHSIVPQTTPEYTENLEKIKPDYVVHGDDWKVGFGSKMREDVINTLKKWGGKLVELPYTPGLSSSYITDTLRQNGISSVNRQKSLRHMLSIKPLVRILEVHNGLCGLIAEKNQD